MALFDSALQEIERGKLGLNKGLPMGFDRLVEYLPNIQQKTYYLLGGRTKDGKTSFVDDCFLYNPYEYIQDNETDLIQDVDYFSFEIDKTSKIIKGICRRIYKKYGLIVDVNTILSRGRNRISTEIYELVLKERNYFDKLEDVLTVFSIDDISNPTGMFKYLKSKAERFGKSTYREIDIGEDKKIRKFESYTQYNPNRYHEIIIDSIGLTEPEKAKTLKDTIDQLSKYLIKLRNHYYDIPIVIQQLTFDADNDMRHQASRLKPTTRDFSDSKYTNRDANVIMSLFNPSAYKLGEFEGYDIDRLGNSYRNLEILCNRDGEPNINIGLQFIGKVGTFKELPRIENMTENHYTTIELLNNKL